MSQKILGDHGHTLSPVFNNTLEVVTFYVGGQRCALDARQVHALRTLPSEDSRKYATIESLLGLPEQNNACLQRQLLTIRLPESDVEFSVAVPVQLHELDFDVIHPLPDLVAARTQLRGLCALGMETDEITLIFDLRNLLSEVVIS
jgi:chemotaxis signal transduction protein